MPLDSLLLPHLQGYWDGRFQVPETEARVAVYRPRAVGRIGDASGPLAPEAPVPHMWGTFSG